MSKTGRSNHPQSPVAVAIVAALLAACAGDGPVGQNPPAPLPPTPFLVSNPSSGLSRTAPNGMSSAPTSATVAWISLPSGRIPDASAVTITNQRTGVRVNASVTDGGFDPVPLPAQAGDTLEIYVVGAVTGGSSTYLALVPVYSRPHVVRTEPPRHKRDVPLNAIVKVTFSEPMDSGSLVGAITLAAGGALVPGSVVIPAQDSGLRAEFVPAAPLLPSTSYEIQVSTAARDQEGAALEAVASSDFTTADTAPTDPDTTPPDIVLLAPAHDTMPVDFPVFRVGVTDDRSLTALDLQFRFEDTLSVPDTLSGWFAHLEQWSSYTDLTYTLVPFLAAGTYAVHVTAWDVARNARQAPPLTIALVDPDTASRIVVRSFSVMEYQRPLPPTEWAYAPQLVVAEAPGQSGLEIVGFEMLSIPGLQSPRPQRWVARSLNVPAGADVALFGDQYYDDFEVAFTAADLGRSTGGTAIARLTYRDASGRYYATTVQGPVVGYTPQQANHDWCHWFPQGSIWQNPPPCAAPASSAVGRADVSVIR